MSYFSAAVEKALASTQPHPLVSKPVTWSSHAGSYSKVKTGRAVAFCPKGQPATKYLPIEAVNPVLNKPNSRFKAQNISSIDRLIVAVMRDTYGDACDYYAPRPAIVREATHV